MATAAIVAPSAFQRVTSSAMARSFLFVPGDSERKLDKALGAAAAGADAIILDLEDSVAEPQKKTARQHVAARLSARPPGAAPELWVRINALQSAHSAEDLAALAGALPDGVLLPKCRSPEDVRELGRRIDAIEAGARVPGASTRSPAGATAIMATVTETPEGALRVAEYRSGAPRLTGITWGAEDLSAALNVGGARDEVGRWLPLFEQLRSVVRIAAAAAGIHAIDTVYTDIADVDGLRAYVAGSRRLGFSGMLAIHPAQVPIINGGFRPTAAELDCARRVVAAFEKSGGAGVIQFEGRMLDLPHLRQARALLGPTG
jgi:citrate lyase subunit beta/citryl-CoA lyase